MTQLPKDGEIQFTAASLDSCFVVVSAVVCSFDDRRSFDLPLWHSDKVPLTQFERGENNKQESQNAEQHEREEVITHSRPILDVVKIHSRDKNLLQTTAAAWCDRCDGIRCVAQADGSTVPPKTKAIAIVFTSKAWMNINIKNYYTVGCWRWRRLSSE